MIKSAPRMYRAEVLLKRARELGIRLALAPGYQLRVKAAQRGTLTPQIKEVLAQHKEVLIEYLLNYCVVCHQQVESYDEAGLPYCARCWRLREPEPYDPVINADVMLGFLAAYTSRLAVGDLIALDCETTSLDRYQAKIVTVQLGKPGQVHILDVRSFYGLSVDEQQTWKGAFQRLFRVPGVTWLGHNLKFDWLFLVQHFGIRPGVTYDTMLAEQCLHNGKDGVKLDMKEAAARYGLSVSKEEQTSTVDLDKKPGWDKPFSTELIAYMVQDVEVPHQLYAAQQPLLQQHDLQRVVALENAALRTVVAMEARGALIDRVQLEKIATSKRQRQADLEQKLLPVLEPAYQRMVQRHKSARQVFEKQLVKDYQAVSGTMSFERFYKTRLAAWEREHPHTARKSEAFKLSSSGHLRAALAEIEVVVEDTKAETLEAVAGRHDCIPDLLEWKKLQTSLTTFCSKLPTHIGPDGRIHTNFRTVVSGRYVTATPNLQAIPKARDGEPAEEDPRRCIVAAAGHKLLAADLSNIELRILAEIAKDATMLRLFAEGKDLHAETAKLMFNLPPETDTKKHLVHGKSARQIAKTINFGLAYGMGAQGLSDRTGVDLETAKELMQRYFATYRGVAMYLKRAGREALQRGYAVTLSGRRRYYPVGGSELSAKNHPIQGTNADILKRALTLLYERLPGDVAVVLTIHDEIVLECPEAKIEEAVRILQECMLDACRDFLKEVTIPTPDVLVADYWKKD